MTQLPAASSPWGMITDYDSSVTRYYATMSDVKSANFQFIVGYQLTPELSIGGGLQVQYIKGRLAKAIDTGSIALYYASLSPALAHLLPSTTAPGANDGYVELRARTGRKAGCLAPNGSRGRICRSAFPIARRSTTR